MKRKDPAQITRVGSKGLASVALGLWLLSLPWTALKTYIPEYSLSGFHVLAEGWLGPLVLNFGWYANAFFVFGLARLFMSSKAPIFSASLAVLLSLETFRFDSLLLNEGGATTPIYGYGVGAILWMLAICALLVASGVRLRERAQSVYDHHGPEGRFIATLGVGLAGALIAISVAFGAYERIVGNATEISRLSGVVFKRGPICTAHEPIPRAMAARNGILEVKVGSTTIYPLADPRRPLEWGIPVVRMNGLDYSLLDTGVPLAIFARPISGNSDATLEATNQAVADDAAFSGLIRLRMTADTTVLFEETWKREHLNIYCPDYSSFPGVDENPRKIIMAALNIDSSKAQGRTEVDNVGKQFIEAAFADGSPANTVDPEQQSACPSSMRVTPDLARSNPETIFLGQPLSIGGGLYFPGSGARAQAICAGDSAYVFTFANESLNLSVIVQKWTIGASRMQWISRALVGDSGKFISPSGLVVRSAHESNGLLHVTLVDKGGKSMRFAVRIAQS